jgi:Mu DNA binding protein
MKPQVIPSQSELQVASDPFRAETWLTVDDIVGLGRSRRKVLINISSGKWPSKVSEQRAANRKRQRVVPLSALPEELRRRYLEFKMQSVDAQTQDDEESQENTKTTSELASEHRLTEALKRYPQDVREALMDEARRLMMIVERYIALPSKRSKVTSCELNLEAVGSSPTVRALSRPSERTSVAEMADAPDTGGTLGTRGSSGLQNQLSNSKSEYEFTPAVLALCKEAACTNETILNFYKSRQHSIRKGTEPRIARAISPRTLDKWARQLKDGGMLIFFPTPPTKAQKPDDDRLAKITPEAGQWIEKHFRHFPTATQCYYRWKQAARKHNWRIPSFAWLARRYQNLDPVAKTAIFLGEKAYTDKHKPFLQRTVNDLAALQLLCGDHHVLDVHCWSEKQKSLVRLWLTAWLDIRTYLLYGCHLDYTPSSTTIGCAYANGVRMFGAQPTPREGFQSKIYVDNGKDYRSRHIDGRLEVHRQAAAIDGGLELLLTDRGVGLARDLDVKVFLARKFNGREKPLERVFRDLADFLQNEFFDRGWCGRNTKDKPDSFRDLYTRHVKAIKAGRPSPFPLESEVRAAVAECIEKHNTTEHTRTVLDGATTIPIQEFQRLYTTHYEIREDTLALLVMKATSGRLAKNGVVALGSHYWSDALSQFKGRKTKDGKAVRVEVRYTDADYTTAWLVLPNGEIVEAVRVDTSSIVTANKESLKAFAERVRSERSLITNASLLQQSIWRGESAWDRMAAQFEPEEEVRVPIAMAGGGGSLGDHDAPATASGSGASASVHQFSRFDRKRIQRTPAVRPVTVDQVAEAAIDESIFEAEEPSEKSEVRMWEDDDD